MHNARIWRRIAGAAREGVALDGGLLTPSNLLSLVVATHFKLMYDPIDAVAGKTMVDPILGLAPKSCDLSPIAASVAGTLVPVSGLSGSVGSLVALVPEGDHLRIGDSTRAMFHADLWATNILVSEAGFVRRQKCNSRRLSTFVDKSSHILVCHGSSTDAAAVRTLRLNNRL